MRETSILLIKIRDIPDAGLTVKLPIERGLLREALAGLEADVDRSHAEAEVSLAKTDDHIFVQGTLRGEIWSPCVRCLREVRSSMVVPLRMIFTPQGEEAEEDEEVVLEEESGLEHGVYDGVQIDLADLLRESLILSVPTTPLCRLSCKGLCGICGGDKNERDCNCKVQLEDPRLAPLKGLKV